MENLKYMTTAEQNGCYTHILFLFQILRYYFAHENRNYPFCSTCLFSIFFRSEKQYSFCDLISWIVKIYAVFMIKQPYFLCIVIVTALSWKSNPVFLFFTLIFVYINVNTFHSHIKFCQCLCIINHITANEINSKHWLNLLRCIAT